MFSNYGALVGGNKSQVVPLGIPSRVGLAFTYFDKTTHTGLELVGQVFWKGLLTVVKIRLELTLSYWASLNFRPKTTF